MRIGTLSVVMPNYNHAKYIGEAIEAILSQSYRPMEIIIIDDASTDNSVEVIEQYAKREPLIRLIRNEKNMGVIYNAKRLLMLARGDYFYSAAADDKILPGFFEKTMQMLNRYPQAGLCCSDPVFLDDSTGVISENHFDVTDAPRYFSSEELIRLLKTHFWIAGHTSIVKRSALVEAGGYIVGLKWYIDWFVYHVIAFRYGICYIPEPLAVMRISPHSYSASGVRQWSEQKTVLDSFFKTLGSQKFSDVFAFFKRSALLPAYNHRVLYFMFTHPHYWRYLSPLLVWNSILGVLAPFVPAGFKQFYLNRLRRNYMALKEVF